MEIGIFNTMAKKTEVLSFDPSKKLKLFVCGPTVYDFSHLGHAKTYVQFDVVAKYLKSVGLEVEYLQNITDIDDKIIKRADENKENWKDLALHFEKEYLEDMKTLRVDAVTKYARATEHIEEIVSQVKRLMDLGYAYETEDGIYFEISKFKDYGKLSGRQEIGEDDAVSRIDSSAMKRGWNDFCLWKKSKPNEPSWETALGVGRPGWHIEDTAITEKYFGPQYDIHGGAVDLIFPHHEAEIAQIEAVSGLSPMVRAWMHAGFLNIEAKKMSKSLGNFKTIREAVKEFGARVVRFYFASAHYRSAMDFSGAGIENAKGVLAKLDEFVFRVEREYDDKENEAAIAALSAAIDRAMNDDFDTPKALDALYAFIKEQNAKKNGKRVLAALKLMDSFLGIFNFEKEDNDDEIAGLVKERDELRKKGDYAGADAIRDKIAAMGYKLYDADGVTKYRKADL